MNEYISSKNQTPYQYIKDPNAINENNPYKRVNDLHDKIANIQFNYRYQQEQLNNQGNPNVHRSQDFLNERDYQNYQNNRYGNNYNNELARSQRINVNYNNRRTEYTDNYNIDNYNYYNNRYEDY